MLVAPEAPAVLVVRHRRTLLEGPRRNGRRHVLLKTFASAVRVMLLQYGRYDDTTSINIIPQYYSTTCTVLYHSGIINMMFYMSPLRYEY